jgi:hypothetical protein
MIYSSDYSNTTLLTEFCLGCAHAKYIVIKKKQMITFLTSLKSVPWKCFSPEENLWDYSRRKNYVNMINPRFSRINRLEPLELIKKITGINR